jgi:hypothetical protein
MLGAAIVLSPFRARIILESRALPPVFGDYRDFLLFWNEVFVFACLVLWGVSLLLTPRKVDFGPAIIRLPVFALIAAIFVSVPFSVDVELSLFHALSVVLFATLGLFVLNEVRSTTQLVPAIGVMVVIQAVVAVGQVVGQESFGLSRLGELNLDPGVRGMSILWTEDEPKLLRAYGMSDHPNILGGVLAFSLPLIGAGLARYRGGWATLANVVFGLGVVGLLLTFSRAGALALVAGVAVVIAMLLAKRDWPEARRWIVACSAALLIAVPLLKPYAPYLSPRVNPVAQQAESTEGRALSERDALVRNTNEIFVDHPLTGVGVSALPTAMLDAFPGFRYNYAPAHLVLLVVAAETGLFGAIAYGVLMVCPWLMLWFHRERLTRELIGVSGALMAITVVGLFDYYTWSLTAGRIWFWLVLALWAGAYRRALDRAVDA